MPWRACLEESWGAYCAGCVPIGAVVTDGNGQILTRGRNRSADPDGPHGLSFGQSLAHAELNALLRLPADGLDRHSCALYTSMEPCPLCLGAWYMSGVRTLYYAARDPWAGSTNLIGSTPYLSRKPVVVFSPSDPHLENLLVAVLIEFTLNQRGPEHFYAHPLFEAMAATLPQGVGWGETLYHSGELRRQSAIFAPIDVVYDRLECELNLS